MLIAFSRKIRSPDGEVYREVYSRDDLGTLVDLYSDQGEAFCFTRNVDGSSSQENSAPAWYAPPTNDAEIAKKLAGKAPTEPTRNVVTFVTYMANGRLQLQQRSYVSPQGKPIANPGFLSINGGLMESDDIEANLRREASEELGVSIFSHFALVGSLYDPEAGRSNHVFRLTLGYDTLLGRYGVDFAVQALCNPEGLGRAFVWREDLQAIIAAGNLTGISQRILEVFPELLPPPPGMGHHPQPRQHRRVQRRPQQQQATGHLHHHQAPVKRQRAHLPQGQTVPPHLALAEPPRK